MQTCAHFCNWEYGDNEWSDHIAGISETVQRKSPILFPKVDKDRTNLISSEPPGVLSKVVFPDHCSTPHCTDTKLLILKVINWGK